MINFVDRLLGFSEEYCCYQVEGLIRAGRANRRKYFGEHDAATLTMLFLKVLYSVVL